MTAATEASGSGGEPRHPADRLRPGTRDPRRSRDRALKLLFQADLRGESPLTRLEKVLADRDAVALLDDQDEPDETRLERATHRTEPLDEYAQRLVRGVADHAEELDALIERFARRWSVARMPTVDRNVLRLAAYELLHEDTSAAVVIDEALELAKAMSTDNSARFVNGVLEAIRQWAQHASEAEAAQDIPTEDD